ncbi:MAG TPA: lysozyme, partial [Allosphingosinicella sp.]|nr:lysozyme [Allosphingosinicella sp.]
MNLSATGLALIKRFEGLRTRAYLCPAGVWTIGYGSTGRHVTEGRVVTAADAEDLLRGDLLRFEEAARLHALPAGQSQYDALVSFAFNVGITAFARSTLLRRHRAGDFAAAASEFGRWDKVRGRVLPGLARRRAAERRLYLS